MFCLIVFSFCNRCLEFVTQAPKTQFDASATAEPCKILPDQSATAEMVNWNPPDVSLSKRKIISIRSECCSRRLINWSPERVITISMNQGRVARMNVESLWAWLGQCPKNSNGSYLVGCPHHNRFSTRLISIGGDMQLMSTRPCFLKRC